MNETGATDVNLLIFSVRGVLFAMDAEQAQSTAPYKGEQADDLFRFQEQLGFVDAEVTCQTPVIVTIRTADSRPYRIIIDSMEDIAEFSLNDIYPFPTILEPFALKNGMWGILRRNGRMALVMDFERLFKRKTDNCKLKPHT